MKWFLLLSLITLNVFAKEIVLTDQNCVSLRGPVDRQSVGDVITDLSKLAQTGNQKDPIYLVLNTPGGSVMAGLELMQYMNTTRRPVHVVANFAASMGFHILQSSKVRYVTQYGTIMSHRASGGFEGDIPQQINSRLKHIIDLVGKMDEQVVGRTNGKFNKETYAELIRDEYWSVGTTAIKDGFADEVASLKCDSTLNGTVTKIVRFAIFEAEVNFSKCPLISAVVSADSENKAEVDKFLNSIRKLEL
jgi:ATP-dependent Clp protease protease subunit